MNKRLRLKNLDCAVCAQELERRVAKVDGVRSARVDFARQSLSVNCESEQALQAAVRAVNGFENVRVCDGAEDGASGLRFAIVSVILAAACLAAGLVLEYAFVGLRGADIAMYALYGAAYLIVGWEILWQTAKNIVHGKIFDENFLMTLASIGAIVLGQYAEAAEVMVLYSLGELLQSAAVGASRRSIAGLMGLKSESATVLREGGQVQIPPEEVKAGDVLLVRAGDKIAADGVIVRGTTALDVRSLTGESVLREAGPGDAVPSGAINAGAVIEVRAQKDYADSTVAKILDLVENSAAKKAKSEKFISRFARIYTPAVVAAAILVAFLVPAFTADYAANLGTWVRRALVFLVISCPCALVISVPLSYFSGIGFAASHGILVKGSTALDALAAVRVAAFDKTGTLTHGKFTVARTYGDSRALAVAAAAERNSAHPIAAAFDGVDAPAAADAREIAGRGIVCTVDGAQALVGNAKLLEEHGIAAPACEGGTLVYVALGGAYLGCIVLEDACKPEAAQAVRDLRAQGVTSCYMLTGDARSRAEAVARQAALDGVYADLMPADKLEVARELRKQGTLLYVGDGINDAPVLMGSDVGASMGGVGSDAAIEASDVVLMTGDLTKLAVAKRIARRTRAVVLQNIAFSIAVKLVVMGLGLFGLIPLGVAVFADVGVMMLAVLNSFRTRLPLRKNG